MVGTGRPGSADGQQSLGDLVALAAKDMSSLVRYEISLAKSEFKMDLRRIGFAAVIAVVGLFVACLVVVLLCFAFAYGLVALGAPGGTWGAFLWVALTCVVLIILGGLTAVLVIRRVTGMKLTRQTVMDDIGMLRRGESSPNGSRPAVSNPGVGNAGVSVGKGTAAEIPPAQS
jgi:membrane protein implicated in regulation of membrane protease activity